MATVRPTWAVAFLQKCCYKWRPRKCLGLVVANLIILFQNGATNPWKSQKFRVFFFSFSEKKIVKLRIRQEKKKNIAPHHANFDKLLLLFLNLNSPKENSNNKTLWGKNTESSKIFKNIKMKILKINNYSTDTSWQGTGGIITFHLPYFDVFIVFAVQKWFIVKILKMCFNILLQIRYFGCQMMWNTFTKYIFKNLWLCRILNNIIKYSAKKSAKSEGLTKVLTEGNII